MRILFLHEVNYLEKPIFEMHEFPEHLAALGHEVAFLQYAEGWTTAQAVRQGFQATISGRVVSAANLELFTPQRASIGILNRLRMALSAGREFRKVLKSFSPDLVVSFSVPTTGWQTLRLSRKLGIPYVFRALDVSHKIRKSPFSPLIKFAERYIYRHSSLVSANNPAMANYCISMGADPKKTVVDLPPLDIEHFDQSASSKTRSRQQLGISQESKVILYMGSFFYFSGLPEVIRCFSEKAPKDIQLVLVGGGEQDYELRQLVTKLGIQDRVHFTGFVSFAELPGYLAAADVAINPMHRSLVSNAAFPNKVIQYMATALPVASTRLDGLELTFGIRDGLRFAESSAAVLDEAVDLLDQGNLESLGESNRSAVASLFSKDKAVLGFEARLKGALAANG